MTPPHIMNLPAQDEWGESVTCEELVVGHSARRLRTLTLADILAVPDLESGNMMAKQLEYMSGATVAGLLLGARVPIALTSRADGPMARVASAPLAKLAAHHAIKAPHAVD